MTTSSRVVSPCIGTCRIDPDRQLCEGCLRTLSEIASWAGMSDRERRAVMDDLPARRRDQPRGS
ncbi:DUF1289 domain-containing protein [Paracoccus sp. 1_MG-2023]|uniref:DUF1289 domain-containing protein n=1 Tax=unclassified Paracoccus (in: a-proteobacteria) TaxID=2688777 RepID=UPI001C08DB25|nr:MULTISPECIES: DUF1289 domain-containing protein [unclassified Paracoccus (in: a-proteobacteria)]MBU2957078.1 DUF1289 domain-containing protein [Paracoccus sp. C2R09]MDO6669588.1 DUF1289 domain-containing protein [Paracoccus sp. 1_MG-2023]